MSRGKRTAADELAIAIEDGDLERDIGALEHARGRPPACSRNEISEGKIFLHRMRKGFRRRIRRQDPLAQCRRRACILCKHGKRDQVIPFELGNALYEGLEVPKELLVCENAGHCEIAEAEPERYYETVTRFVRAPAPK